MSFLTVMCASHSPLYVCHDVPVYVYVCVCALFVRTSLPLICNAVNEQSLHVFWIIPHFSLMICMFYMSMCNDIYCVCTLTTVTYSAAATEHNSHFLLSSSVHLSLTLPHCLSPCLKASAIFLIFPCELCVCMRMA